MSKKHYQALAKALAEVRPEVPKGLTESVPVIVVGFARWQKSVDAVANVCKAFNPAFDYDIFFKACME